MLFYSRLVPNTGAVSIETTSDHLGPILLEVSTLHGRCINRNYIDHLGPMARTVEDCALLLEVSTLHGRCINRNYIDHLGPMARTVEDCALLLEVSLAGMTHKRNHFLHGAVWPTKQWTWLVGV